MTTYWTSSTDESYKADTSTTADFTPSSATTTDPNSLIELMRNAIILQGDEFPYDPNFVIREDQNQR